MIECEKIHLNHKESAMTPIEIAQALNVDPAKITENFASCFDRIEENRHRLCSKEMICRLQEKFDVFSDHYEAVLSAWEDLEKSPEKKRWADAAALHVLDHPLAIARHTPFPATDETPAGDMLPLFALIPSMEPSYNEYRERGFSEEQCQKFMTCYKGNMNRVRSTVYGRSGLTTGLFDWLCIYAKVRIFDHAGLNFEIRKQGTLSLILRNKKTGEIMPLVANRTIHRSGYPLGCGGKDDEEGSFFASLEETDKAWIGHPTVDFLVSREKKEFSKEEWEAVLSNGDDCIGIHIPRKTDFSPEAVSRSLNEAWNMICNYYPDLKPKAFTCTSWLLDPRLQGMLGENSKISAFAQRFCRYPAKSSGREVFSFVFNRKFGDFETLPEDTSLQRGLKKIYLDGDYIYGYSGVILPE